MGCSAAMINEAIPNVPLTLRQRCLVRSMITKIITGKKGLQSVRQPARVSNSAPQPRNETPEARPLQIELRSVLLVSVRSRDEPTVP
jgi:hypothetical protein